jgi:hypothetical protein
MVGSYLMLASGPKMLPWSTRAKQPCEALLLAIVEALVKRINGIGEALKSRRLRCHRIGALAQTLNHIALTWRSLRWTLHVAKFMDMLGALFGALAQRAFDSRPIFLLVGGEPQSCFQRGDARIGKRGDILGAWLPTLDGIATGGSPLSKHQASANNRERGCSGKNYFPHDYLQWSYGGLELKISPTLMQVKVWSGCQTVMLQR